MHYVRQILEKALVNMFLQISRAKEFCFSSENLQEENTKAPIELGGNIYYSLEHGYFLCSKNIVYISNIAMHNRKIPKQSLSLFVSRFTDIFAPMIVPIIPNTIITNPVFHLINLFF